MKRYLLLILGSFLVLPLLNAQKKAPNIYAEIYDENYDFGDLAATFNTINILYNVNLTPYHVGSFGLFRLSNGQKIVQRSLQDINAPGLGNISIAQAFNLHRDGSFSVWTLGSDLGGYYVLDDSLNIVMNLEDAGVYADPHGIEKLSDGQFAFFDQRDTFMSFFSPSYSDTSSYDVTSYNVSIFNPQDSSIRVVFDWFQQVPISMLIPEYFLEGDFGSSIIEWGHPNSIFQDFDDNLLVSWRNLGVCKIDIVTGNVVWWAGLPNGLALQNGFNELNCIQGDCRFRLQHDFKPLKNHPGSYTLFDNGDTVRENSRAVFFDIDELNNTISIQKEQSFVPTDLMGSVDVLENGSYLVDVVDINGIPQERIPQWVQSGFLFDSIGAYIHLLGSKLYLFDSSDVLVAKYWTDSANIVYNSFLTSYENWPKVDCNDEYLMVSNAPNNFVWKNQDDLSFGVDTFINISSGTYRVDFPFGVATASSVELNANKCLQISIDELGNQSSLRVFPNPASQYITFDKQIDSYQLLDVFGSMVKSGNESLINIESLSKGTYFVRAFIQDEIVYIKFIKD